MPPTTRPGPTFGTTTEGLSTMAGQLGGHGRSYRKQLVDGGHLAGDQVRSVEWVRFPAGASCGLHAHTDTATRVGTEELYVVVEGAASLLLDGAHQQLLAGDAATTPVGSSHGFTSTGPGPLELLVVEVYRPVTLPARRLGPHRVSLRALLEDDSVERPADGVRVATLELAAHFTAAWRPLRLSALTPGAVLGPSRARDAETILVVTRGQATLQAGDEQVSGGVYATVPPGLPYTITAASDPGAGDVEVAIIQVGA